MFEEIGHKDYLDGIGEVGRIGPTLAALRQEFVRKHPFFATHPKALLKLSRTSLIWGIKTLPRKKRGNFPLQGLEAAAPAGISNAVLLAVRNERPTDPITRMGTIIEQKTGFPVIIKAIQAGLGKPLKTIVTPLPLTSPLDVSHYEKDTDAATIFPVFKLERVSNPASYREMSENPAQYFPTGLSGLSDPYLSDVGLEGYGDAELAGFFDVFKSAFSKVKKFATHPIQTIKTSLANRRNRKLAQSSKTAQMKGQAPDKRISLIQWAVGAMPAGKTKEAAQKALEDGDFDTADRLRTGAEGAPPPEERGAGGGALPGWVLPAGIGVAALLFMKGTKYAPGGGRRRR